MKLKDLSLPVLMEKWSNHYWVVPALTAFFITALLPLMRSVEENFFHTLSDGFFVGYSAEAARLILSSISTALMTVIGVLFSITVVVVQQASAQYSPRVVEIFIKSRNSQFVLGLYVGTFIYSILLLRQIPAADNEQGLKIPQSAVSLAIILALVCICFLVQYVHYITHAIKSTNIINSIIEEGLDYLDEYEDFKSSHDTHKKRYEDVNEVCYLTADRHGYFQSYLPENLDRLLGKENRTVVTLLVHVGEYLNAGEKIAEVRSVTRIAPRTMKKLQKVITMGPERTHAQDVRYSIRQLVDIALRALSPGINDPTTASEALNGVRVILSRWLGQSMHSGVFTLKRGNQLVIGQLSLDTLLEQSFAQVIISARGHYQVLEKILRILEGLRPALEKDDEIALLESYIRHLRKHCEEEKPEFIQRRTGSQPGPLIHQ